MRRFINPLLIAVSFCVCQFANGQTATNPVGFTTVTVNASTIKALSLPFNRVPDYASAVSAVTTGATPTIQTVNAGWTTNAFGPFVGNPANAHVIRMTSGGAVGKQFRILSNTSDTLTLISGTDVTGVAANDQYQIFACETLQSLFGANGTLNGQSLNTHPSDPAVADNVQIRTGTSWNTYYNNGTQWLKTGTNAASNTVAVPPEQGFVLIHRAGSPYTFTALGAVPITNLKTDFSPNTINSLGNRFPVDTTLAGMFAAVIDPNNPNYQPGWNKNSDPGVADNVLLRIGTSWNTYYHDGNNWVKTGTGAISNTQAIPTGTSVVVVRRAGTTVTLNQPLPYTL